jgi:hypothetical protein
VKKIKKEEKKAMNKTKIIQDIIVHLNGIIHSLEDLSGVLETDQTEPEAEIKVKEEAVETEKVNKPKQPTIEDVRAAMAGKNREGHREEVKTILIRYGANKLTALDSKHYAEVLKEVGEI